MDAGDAVRHGGAPGIQPHRPSGTEWRPHEPLPEPRNGGDATEDGEAHLLGRRSSCLVEHEERADGHGHAPAAVDGELEHVVGGHPVDVQWFWFAHDTNGRPVRAGVRPTG